MYWWFRNRANAQMMVLFRAAEWGKRKSEDLIVAEGEELGSNVLQCTQE
jgi:hypothetical protein